MDQPSMEDHPEEGDLREDTPADMLHGLLSSQSLMNLIDGRYHRTSRPFFEIFTAF